MNIIDVLKELEVPHLTDGHEHCRDGWVQIDCVHCTPGMQRWRCGIPINGFVANCWACGKFNLAETLSRASNRRIEEVRGVLAVYSQNSPITAPQRARKEVGGRYVPPGMLTELNPVHDSFLRKRRFDPEEIERLWSVRGICLHPRLPWRLFIPIFHNWEPVSWTTRSIVEDHAVRYRSATPEEEKIHLREILYGEDYCRHAIAVQEGPPDAWAIGPGAVATLGTGYSELQLLRMIKYPVRIICFDNEPAAQVRARKLCDELAVFPGTTHNVTFSAKDASRSPKSEIREFRKRFLE